MRASIIILFALAVGCEVFAVWGVYTRAGRAAFDEMAGMLPMAAFPLGAVLALAAAGIWYFSRR